MTRPNGTDALDLFGAAGVEIAVSSKRNNRRETPSQDAANPPPKAIADSKASSDTAKASKATSGKIAGNPAKPQRGRKPRAERWGNIGFPSQLGPDFDPQEPEGREHTRLVVCTDGTVLELWEALTKDSPQRDLLIQFSPDGEFLGEVQPPANTEPTARAPWAHTVMNERSSDD